MDHHQQETDTVTYGISERILTTDVPRVDKRLTLLAMEYQNESWPQMDPELTRDWHSYLWNIRTNLDHRWTPSWQETDTSSDGVSERILTTDGPRVDKRLTLLPMEYQNESWPQMDPELTRDWQFYLWSIRTNLDHRWTLSWQETDTPTYGISERILTTDGPRVDKRLTLLPMEYQNESWPQMDPELTRDWHSYLWSIRTNLDHRWTPSWQETDTPTYGISERILTTDGPRVDKRLTLLPMEYQNESWPQMDPELTRDWHSYLWNIRTNLDHGWTPSWQETDTPTYGISERILTTDGPRVDKRLTLLPMEYQNESWPRSAPLQHWTSHLNKNIQRVCSFVRHGRSKLWYAFYISHESGMEIFFFSFYDIFEVPYGPLSLHN